MTAQIRRRDFITLIGGAVLAWPMAARAQQPQMPVIGFLHNASRDTRREGIAAFHRGLAQTGYIEGQNVTIEYRWAEGHNDRLAALAADLVRREVAVIAAPGNTPSALAAKAATRTIPILFLVGPDPVESGLVASLNRPGGNVTGISLFSTDLAAKRLELLRDLVPTARLIGFLRNPTSPASFEIEANKLQIAANAVGVHLVMVDASTREDIEAAFATLIRQRVEALLVSADAFFFTQVNQLAGLAARNALPTISHFREFTTAGGLISYGPSFPAAYREVGVYTGRILKGEKPADLPVQQAVKIELVLNKRTANALGLVIPDKLLVFADEVIE